MASVLSSSNLLFSSNLSCCCSSSPSCSGRINAAISVPRIPNIRFAPRKAPITSDLIGEQRITDLGLKSTTQAEKSVPSRRINEQNDESSSSVSMATAQLYAVLEAVSDRVEVHRNIGEQRDNWNTLLLNSINMITLTASAMAGVAATAAVSGEDSSLLALKLSSTLLFSCATAMTIMVNKIQPSQLAEEQRNAVRLFKQIQSRIQTLLSVKVFNEEDVKEITEEVLALDKAYPLPLLGNKMIEKFPKSFTPAVWWPSKNNSTRNQKLNRVTKRSGRNNGWNEELEIEMREVMEVINNKDAQDYNRLGNMVLKINKILAISGPVLMGIAAVGSGCVGSQHGSMAAVVASAAGSLAAVVNSLEHGGQVGMVVEMYRNCYGMFNHLEESIKSNLNEREFEKRENGEIFEMKVALGLGRSVSGLRDFTRKSRFSRMHGVEIEEFASKLM